MGASAGLLGARQALPSFSVRPDTLEAYKGPSVNDSDRPGQSQDPFEAEAGGKSYAYYSLEKAGGALGDMSRLPFSMKVLLENLP